MKKRRNKKMLWSLSCSLKRGLLLSIWCMMLGLACGNAYGQAGQKKITMNVTNVTVLEALHEVNRLSGNLVLFMKEEVEREKGRVTINVQNLSLLETVKKIIARTELSCVEKNGRIVVTPVKQQMIKIKGVVMDKLKQHLPGVTIRLKGTIVGTATDINGAFTLTLPKQDTVVLVFSFVGMQTKEVKWNKEESLEVVMEEDTREMQEVVVTGYANISRQSFTGNVTTISAMDLKKVSPNNVLKSIQVFDPSFRIAVNNEMGSNPNALPEISVRGASGIGLTELDEAKVSKTALQNNPNLPTFIMDGFEVSISKVYDMDINRIESITLLKDAAATAIYGSRAANGVVIITTVAPKEGEVLLSYNYDMNVQFPNLDDYNLMGAREKLEAEVAAGVYDQSYASEMNYQYKLQLLEKGVDTDWLSKPLRNTVSSKHYLRMEGGSKGLRYGLDVNYSADNGVMRGSERKRWGINFELQYNTGKFLFKNTAGFTGVNSEESPYGNFSDYTSLNPYYPYLDEDGTYLKTISIPYEGTVNNPLYEASLDSYEKSKNKEFTNNFSMQYHLTDKIYFKGNIALTYTMGKFEAYTSPESGKYKNTTYKGEMTLDDVTATVIDGGIFGYYNDVIKGHSINLVAGINVKESSDESRSVYVRDLPEGGFSNPQFAKEFPQAPVMHQQKTRLFGALVSLNYTYNNIYLLDATWRLDGNSAFGSDSRFAPFWSGGLGVNLHNMGFMQGVDWISELKLRGSYGVTGKANFPANTAQTVYTINGTTIYPTGVGSDITALGNRKLKWERTRITDLGGSVNFWNGMVQFNGTYYFRKTVDLIADVFIPASSGFLSYKDNIGEITNNGYELSLRVRPISNDKLQWFVGGNLASNKNEIKKISESLRSYNEKIEAAYQDKVNVQETKKPLLKFVEGASTTSIYAMRSLGIDPQTGKELFRYKDGSVGTTWIASENVAVGNTEPKVNGAFFSNLFYKGISLDLYFTYTYGGQQYNQTLQTKIENADIRKNVDKRVFTDRWKKPGDKVGFKSLADWEIPTNATSRFVEDDNTLTLQSLSLGYELPRDIVRKIRFDRVKFVFNMNDVFRVSSIKQERGLSYPFARSFSFSVNVGF